MSTADSATVDTASFICAVVVASFVCALVCVVGAGIEGGMSREERAWACAWAWVCARTCRLQSDVKVFDVLQASVDEICVHI